MRKLIILAVLLGSIGVVYAHGPVDWRPEGIDSDMRRHIQIHHDYDYHRNYAQNEYHSGNCPTAAGGISRRDHMSRW